MKWRGGRKGGRGDDRSEVERREGGEEEIGVKWRGGRKGGEEGIGVKWREVRREAGKGG